MRSPSAIGRPSLWSPDAPIAAETVRRRRARTVELRDARGAFPGRRHLREPGARCRFPRSGGPESARRFLLRLCDADRDRRQMGQYPARPIARQGPRRHLATRSAKPGGRRRRWNSGSRRRPPREHTCISAKPDAAWATTSAACASRWRPPAARAAFVDIGKPLQCGEGSSTSTHVVDDRGAACVRAGLTADQGAGASSRPVVVRCRKQARDNGTDIKAIPTTMRRLGEGAWVISRDG